MEIVPLNISGAWLANSKINTDSRGKFREWFKLNDIQIVTGVTFETRQANISTSSRGTVRGIHYSLSKEGQAKWVTCVSGKIRDVVVDIRVGSPTFGKWINIEISASDGNSILVGHGLGHGFSALEDNTCVAYLVSVEYSPDEEFEIYPLDEFLNIDWGVSKEEMNISEKDRLAPGVDIRKIKNQLPMWEK